MLQRSLLLSPPIALPRGAGAALQVTRNRQTAGEGPQVHPEAGEEAAG